MFYTLTIHYYVTYKSTKSWICQYTYNFRTYKGLKQILNLIDNDIRKNSHKVTYTTVNKGIMFD